MALKLLQLLLLVAARAAHCRHGWAPEGSDTLCHFELLPAQASCSLQETANGTCQILKLQRGSCFQKWDYCREKISFIENVNFTQGFDEDTNTTFLEIYGYKGTRFLVETMRPENTWWQVDVPEGEHNITITGLPLSLNETAQLYNTVYCEGCPSPRVSYIALRKLHKFQITVSPSEEQMSKGFVSVSMASTNETDFIRNKKCNSPGLKFDKRAQGKINEAIVIKEVFGTEFCFVIVVNWEKNETRYGCTLQKNMTEPPFQPFRASIDLPVWWVVGTVFLLIILALSTLVPLAIKKGLWRRRRWRRLRGSSRVQESEADHIS